MSNPIKIALITVVTLGIIGLVSYGYISTREIEMNKEAQVKSNISAHLNLREVDEKALEEDPDVEDLDGEEALVEDDDFETYVEPEENDWPDEAEVVEQVVVQKPPSKPATEVADSTFLVITGSFKSGSNARKNVRRLKKLGFEAEVLRSKKTKLNSVCVGHYDSETKAQVVVQKLLKEHKQKAFVRKTVIGKEDE